MTQPKCRQIKLLCHFSGDLTDSSVYNNTVSNVGGTGEVLFSSSPSKFGQCARAVPIAEQSGGNLQSNFSYNFSGAFTVDWWGYMNSTSGNTLTNPVSFGSTHNIKFLFGYNGDGGDIYHPGFFIDNALTVSPLRLTNRAWHHIAISRSEENLLKLYVDGSLRYSVTNSADFSGNIFDLGGCAPYNNGKMYYWQDEFRVVEGADCFPAAFAVPTAPYVLPDIYIYIYISTAKSFVKNHGNKESIYRYNVQRLVC